ncbi:hypothetical protein J2848_003858 [Azospirillum lipoferum]|uniref:Uncharacterized protein n=1 Tax=Azospirillum lipoferum TaxID=193 RepID=A0A5A9G444_AZOLI|nr:MULTISPECIES: hypothetical protein [Azospirillum]KAA0587979.1 hypothetical protein FZ942_33780 [Azospirillum lipoferum]MCP1612178.1 hypothetical protein [Azospirillum lipoferum]MDW5536600.1 hypothetical protein [Azospirillum sp. NL1]
MLHIKDIEAFARINEALNEEPGTDRQADQPSDTDAGQHTSNAAHPALVMAMLATGRLPLSALSKPDQAKLSEVPTPWNRMFRRS